MFNLVRDCGKFSIYEKENMENLKKIISMINEITECDKCETLKEVGYKRITPAPYFLGLNYFNTRLMFLGRNPGIPQDEEFELLKYLELGDHARFVWYHCKLGQFINQMLYPLGLTVEDIFFTNVIKCPTSNNREPFENEEKNCQKFLYKQIYYLKPKVVIGLGAFPAKALSAGTMYNLVDVTILKDTKFETSFKFYGMNHPTYFVYVDNSVFIDRVSKVIKTLRDLGIIRKNGKLK